MNVRIQQPVAADIREEQFVSPADQSIQTYLIAESPNASLPVPLLAFYLHGGLNHQEQGMTAGIYNNFFGRAWNELAKRRAVYVCPEYRGNSWMGPAAEADILHIIRSLRKRCCPQKVVLMGGSMGGTSALIFASRHPAKLDAAMALCPATDMAELFRDLAVSENPDLRKLADDWSQSYGGTPEQAPAVYRERSSRYNADKLAGLPLVIVHGSADSVISVRHSRLLVEELKKRYARLLYHEIDGGDHDSPVVKADIAPYLDFLLAQAG
ncbi:MAG: alpha/beta fold hydrolase [Planctomycetes bacterium]|nr:alpha/beta fold hydrolase [Planctomycetota bacterium]